VTSGNPFLGCQPNGLINSGFVPVSAPAAPPAAPTAVPSAVPLASRDIKNVHEKRQGFLFPHPSQPAQGGGDAGVLPSFKIAILDFLPLTLYCAQGLHCQNGMVMVINPTPNVSILILDIVATDVNSCSRVQHHLLGIKAFLLKQVRI
jgi:hypothetical protein